MATMQNAGNPAKPFLLFMAALVVMAITVAVYYPSLHGDFVWDDLPYLMGNPHIQKFNWENVTWMFTTFHLSNWHPLTWLSFAFDYYWQGGLISWGFHLTNVILHSLNSIGLLFLAILLLNKARDPAQTTFYPQTKVIGLAAFIAALLFGIHPQHVESVAWMSERKDVLCQFFILLTVICYVFHAAATTKKIRPIWFGAALFCFLLALMAKPMAVTLPVVLLLLDVYPLQRTPLAPPPHPTGTALPWRRILVEKIPFFILTLISIGITLVAQTNAIVSADYIHPWIRAINAINSVFLYISKFLLPIALSPLYNHPDYLQHPLSALTLVAGFLIANVLLIYYWVQKKYYPLVIWLFYLVTLSPVIGIIQVGDQSAADRYAYLPTTPFYILVGVGIARLYHHPRQRFDRLIQSSLIMGVLLIALVLFKLNRDQLQIWKNSLVFWTYVTLVNPTNSLAHHNLAVVYFFQKKDYEKALHHTRLSIAYSRFPILEQVLLAEILMPLGQFEEAINAYQNALRAKVDPNLRHDCAHYNMGWMYAKLGQFEAAQHALAQVLAGSPEYPLAQTLSAALTDHDHDQAEVDRVLTAQGRCFSYTLYWSKK